MRNTFNWLAILLGSLLGLILAILTALILVSSVERAQLKPYIAPPVCSPRNLKQRLLWRKLFIN